MGCADGHGLEHGTVRRSSSVSAGDDHVLARMDGTRTVRELYADLSAADSLAEGASIDRLASYIHMLASHGFVEL